MTIRALPVLAALLFSGAALTACQTPSTVPPSGTTAAAKPAEVKPAESGKPPTDDALRVIVANCFNCHGPNGQSPGSIPSLNTLSADDIAARLKSFKTGGTASTVMGRHAKGYSDAEIDAMAKYIAGLKR